MSFLPVYFDNADNRDFIISHGKSVTYYESYPCTCTANQGQNIRSCPYNCDDGLLYKTGVKQQMLLTNIQISKNTDDFGAILEGQAILTVQSINTDGTENAIWKAIKQDDIIVVNDSNRRNREFLKRGVRDTIMSFQVPNLIELRYKNTIINSSYYTYNSTTRTITFTGGVAGTTIPDVSEFYLALFDEKTNFRVFKTMPQNRGNTGQPLPKKLIVQLRTRTLDSKDLTYTNFRVNT